MHAFFSRGNQPHVEHAGAYLHNGSNLHPIVLHRPHEPPLTFRHVWRLLNLSRYDQLYKLKHECRYAPAADPDMFIAIDEYSDEMHIRNYCVMTHVPYCVMHCVMHCVSLSVRGSWYR